METTPPSPPMIAPEQPRVEWNLAKRVAFRFVFLYAVLYLTPFLTGLQELVVKPVSIAVFGKPAVAYPTGSGDRWFDWVWLLVAASAATLGTLVWSVLDRRRPSYPRLFVGLLVYIRFVLGFTILSYGFAKLWPLQFPAPSPRILLEPVGSMSPMGLLWTFMGQSRMYSIFAGSLEVVGAFLLFFRRTALLGAVILIGVMANVVMMNLAYDVPVKQYSLHLLAFCCLIAAPQAGRLLHFFVLDSERQQRLGLAITGVVAAGLIVSFLGIQSYARHRDGVAAGPFDGVYDVTELSRNGQIVPPSPTEKTRWHRVGIGAQTLAVLTVDDTLELFRATAGADGRHLAVIDVSSGGTQYLLTLTPEEGGFVVQGSLRDGEVRASLRKVDSSKLLLTSRGFRWVQEYPFNR